MRCGGGQRSRTAARAVGGAAGVAVLLIGAVWWANRADEPDRSVVGTEPPIATSTTGVRSSSTIPDTTMNIAPESIVEGVPALSPIGSFGSPVDDSTSSDFAFTPDGTRVVTREVTEQFEGWLVLDGTTGDEVMRLATNYGTGNSLGYGARVSPDGSRFTDGRVLWDVQSGAVVAVLSNLGPDSSKVASFSSDSTKLVALTNCESTCVTVFDAKLGLPLYEIPVGLSYVRPAFSPDGSELVMPGRLLEGDWPLRVFDASSGVLERMIPVAFITSVDFVAGGERLLLSGAFVDLLDYASGESVPLAANRKQWSGPREPGRHAGHRGQGPFHRSGPPVLRRLQHVGARHLDGRGGGRPGPALHGPATVLGDSAVLSRRSPGARRGHPGARRPKHCPLAAVVGAGPLGHDHR